jgi:hypothetical protein
MSKLKELGLSIVDKFNIVANIRARKEAKALILAGEQPINVRTDARKFQNSTISGTHVPTDSPLHKPKDAAVIGSGPMSGKTRSMLGMMTATGTIVEFRVPQPQSTKTEFYPGVMLIDESHHIKDRKIERGHLFDNVTMRRDPITPPDFAHRYRILYQQSSLRKKLHLKAVAAANDFTPEELYRHAKRLRFS